VFVSLKPATVHGCNIQMDVLSECVTPGRYGKNTKVLHFIGPVKPWHTSYNASTGHVEVQGDAGNYTVLLKLWWNVFMDKVRPKLDDTQVGQCCVTLPTAADCS